MNRKVIALSTSEQTKIRFNTSEWENFSNRNSVIPNSILDDLMNYVLTNPSVLLKGKDAKSITHKEAYSQLLDLEQEIMNVKNTSDEEKEELIGFYIDLIKENLTGINPDVEPLKGHSLQENDWTFDNHYALANTAMLLHLILQNQLSDNIEAKNLYEHIIYKSLFTGLYSAPCLNRRISELLLLCYVTMPVSTASIILKKIDTIEANMQDTQYIQSAQQKADLRFLKDFLTVFYNINHYFLGKKSALLKPFKTLWPNIESDKTDVLDDKGIKTEYIQMQDTLIRLIRTLIK